MVQEILDLLASVDNTEDLDVINYVLQRRRAVIAKRDLLAKLLSN